MTNEKVKGKRERAEQFMASSALSGRVPDKTTEALVDRIVEENINPDEASKMIRKAYGLKMPG